MTTGYTILETSPTIYNDPVKGVVNGVLVRFRLDAYNEVHEVRVPKLDASVVKLEIETFVKSRDELASLGKSK